MNTSRVSDGLRVCPVVGELFGREMLSSLTLVRSLHPAQQKAGVQMATEDSNLLNMPPGLENETDS